MAAEERKIGRGQRDAAGIWVEICKEDAWIAHQEGIKNCTKFMKKKETRRQCIENEIQLYADMLVQCQENLRCRK